MGHLEGKVLSGQIGLVMLTELGWQTLACGPNPACCVLCKQSVVGARYDGRAEQRAQKLWGQQIFTVWLFLEKVCWLLGQVTG